MSHCSPCIYIAERDSANCTQRLYNKAVDCRLISFDENFRLVSSEKVKAQAKCEMVKKYFLEVEGKEMEVRSRFKPDVKAMRIR